jgi:hypothetical protein
VLDDKELASMTKIKAYAAGVVALIACPCHLPITLPLLVSLTAGTVLGSWLAQNTVPVGVISTVAFIGGLALAFKWFTQPTCPPVANAMPSLSKTKTQSMK